MALSTRQYGRRGGSNANTVLTNNTNIGGVWSSSGTSLTIPSSRRYVLDVPKSRTVRTSRATRTINTRNNEYDEANIRSRSAGTPTRYTTVLTTNVNNENGERLSRSGSREYYFRDGGSEQSTATVTRYLEDPSVRELIESETNYVSAGIEDQEVQALTVQATPDVKNYPINVDDNPELIVRPNNQRLTYTQDIAVRYLRPNTPPPPGVRLISSY